MKQTIMWTALPNGVSIDGTTGKPKLRLSVFVSPRLQTSTALSDFPDFLDWPGTLFPDDTTKHVRFQVQFGSESSSPITVDADRVGALPEPQLWTALFSETTYVKPYEFPAYQDRPVQSYPVRNVQSFLKQQYVKLAVNYGEEFPSAMSLLAPGAFRPLAFAPRTDNNEEQLTGEIMEELLRVKHNPPRLPGVDPSKDFLQAKLFHQPLTKELLEKIPIPTIDFHSMVSLLGEYPVLLRRMGLVHDLEVPFPDFPLGFPGDTTVQVIADWTRRESDVETINIPNGDSGGTPRRLMTRCHVGTGSFFALPRAADPELADGMLPFDDTDRYEVVRIDPDGAALKALDFAKNLAVAQLLRRTDDTPQTSSVPSLRSGGFSVARVGKAGHYHLQFVQQHDSNEGLENGDDTTLDAEAITRGFAIDVWDSLSEKWHSLCQRVGTYKFTSPNIPPENVEDESWTSAAMTSAADGSSPILRLGESLFRWWGWSLAAPRPGWTMGSEGNPVPPGTDVHPDFNLEAHFKAKPYSLPRLRYGAAYRLRARAVDLAGNRRSLDDPALGDFLHATPELLYGRFEPVPPPVVVMRWPRTEGESVERLVIRSNFDTSKEEKPAERHIAPPKASQTMAEEHGLFDNPSTGLVDTAAYSVIVPREAGTIADVGTKDPDNYDQPYVDAGSLTLPYLPDLFSRGAALRDLPSTTEPVLVDFPYDTEWPYALPFRLVLQEGSTKPFWDQAIRVLLVLLPKAEVARVRLSSWMNIEDAYQMGLVQWITEAGRGPSPVVALAARGSHWMLTPYRVLTLVHAVRQPLLEPAFDRLEMERYVAQTFATLRDRKGMVVSRKSTVKVDIIARWDETIDPLPEPGPRVIKGLKARPFELPVPLAPGPDVLILEGRHEFGDTKYRAVDYSAVATSRFGEYFLQRKRDVQLTGFEPYTLDPAGVVEGSEAVRLADGTATYTRYDPDNYTGDYVMNYAAGTIRRRLFLADDSAQGIPMDAILEVTYIVPPITRETAKPTRLHILSSARPAAPKVLYAIPTFGWTTITIGPGKKTIASRRRGGGLRIYTERPWFSSGDGELLAAVLWPGNPDISLVDEPLPEKVKSYATQWGLDPLFQSKQTDPRPTLAAFKLSKPQHQATGLSLEEVPGVKVNVAGHEVSYDSDRGLWYCDMEIDTGQSYFPFIRLALARYQPMSLPTAVEGPSTVVGPGNVHLSRVVLADFIQLAPDRFASVTRDATVPRLLHVSVTGRSYQVLTGQAAPSRMEVSLEKRREGIDPKVAEELAWEPVFWAGGEVRVVLNSAPGQAGNTVWTGDIQLPEGPGPFRLVIKEFELYQGQRRLVYADAIEIKP